MNKPKVIAYLKPTCGWSQGVRAVLRKYDLPFEDRDIINDPAQRQEMMEKSGQPLSPAWRSTATCWPTSAASEVEAYLWPSGLVQPTDRRRARRPLTRPCADELRNAFDAVD